MREKKILVTGGAGFIGSNFIRHILKDNPNNLVINVNKLTYAGKGKNLEHMGLSKHQNYFFYLADIMDYKSLKDIFSEQKPDYVVNFAAETHVDRSIEDPSIFIKTNFDGVFTLLELSRKYPISKFIQISTDEVYGSLELDSVASKEENGLNPRSPYSASKAAADHLALSYYHTYGVPVVITRSGNNFGPYQFPEKLIPLFITHLMQGKKVPLMWSEENPGLNMRNWIYIGDNCKAIELVLENGEVGEVYNVPGNNEISNINLTRKILNIISLGEGNIEHTPHRKGHYLRYSINGEKLKQLGFTPTKGKFDEKLQQTIFWYQENEDWWRPLKK